MIPRITLDEDTVRANVQAWERQAGVPIWPVLKNDGYGWGAARLARALEAVVPGFFVSDADEFTALRAATARPIALLTAAGPAAVGEILGAGGIPTLAQPDEALAAANWARDHARVARVRVGVRPAAGWSGIDPAEAAAFAPLCASSWLEVDLWTHVTAPELDQRQREALFSVARVFRESGARVGSLDFDATPSVGRGPAGRLIRLGAGLFGARCSARTEGLRSAIVVEAPLVSRHPPGTVATAGYGAVTVPPDQTVIVARCGYGDGFPRALGHRGLLAMGMQYTIASEQAARIGDGERLILLAADDDIDALCAAAGRDPREVIVALGQAVRSRA